MGIANPHEAVMMASLNPAKSVHIDDAQSNPYAKTLTALDKDLEL